MIGTGYHFTRCDVDPLSLLEVVPDAFYVKNWILKRSESQRYGEDWLKSNRTLFLGCSSRSENHLKWDKLIYLLTPRISINSPATPATNPPTISQMVLSVGEPVNKRETPELKECDACIP
jgi:hypothetical protein